MRGVFYFLLFSLGVSTSLKAQDIFSKTATEITNTNSKETLSIIDNEDNINLFFISNNKIHYIKTSSNGGKILESEYENPEEFIFENSRGYTINNENKIILFFSNAWHTKYKSLIVPNTNGGKYELNDFEIKNKKEKHLFFANGKNKFYIYKYIKNSSIINRYEVSKNIDNITSFDLSKERFYNKDNEICTLSEVLKLKRLEETDNIMSFGHNPIFKNNSFFQPSTGYTPKNGTTEVNNSLPSSIEIASRKIKTYIIDNQHLITLNHRKSATRIISLSTQNNTFKVYHFNIPTRDFQSGFSIKSNSFIYTDKIYQFICSKNRINISAYNLNTKELIKEYKFKKDDELTILNSPMTQKGGTYMFGGERSLKKTSQLLRKLSNSQDTGLFVFENDGKLNLTLGGLSEINYGYGFSNTGGGLVGFASSTFGAYASYSTTRSVYIDCLFNPNTFEHMEGNIQENVFDKADKYATSLKETNQLKKLKLETVFQYKGYFIQGYYDKKNKEYTLVKHN